MQQAEAGSPGQDAEPVADWDGPKPSLAKAVHASPRHYSILRSTTPRFGLERQVGSGLPVGVYNVDTAHRKSLASSARDSRRFYAATFISASQRFARPWTSSAVDVVYDVHTSCNSRPATVSHVLATTARNYHWSTDARLKPYPHGEAPDVCYDTDVGPKASMYTAMLQSPIKYSNVGMMESDLVLKRPPTGTRTGQDARDLGPGAYDFPIQRDVRASLYLEIRPLSSMMSRSPRFAKQAPVLSHGTTWTPAKDEAAWARRGTKIPTTRYLRPQYLPKFFEKDAGARRSSKRD